MRAYRIFTMVATLATIGSFVVELWQVGHWSGRTDQAPSIIHPRAVTPEDSRPAIRDTPVQDTAGCDLPSYEAAVRMLREKAQSAAPQTGRFERVGEDPTHVYIFDYAKDKLLCVVRLAPASQVVLASHTDRPESNGSEVIFWAVVVIVLASIGLVVIQLVREA